MKNQYIQRIMMAVVFWVGWMVTGYTQHHIDISHEDQLKDLMVVHPQFRMWATPSAGMVVEYNSPMMLWPVTREDGMTYDVRISRSPNFESIAFQKSRIPYAIYNTYETLDMGDWYWQYRNTGETWSEPQHFRVSEKTRTWSLPSADRFRNDIPRQHPRILVKKDENRDGFRLRVGTSPDVEIILNEAGKYLLQAIPDESLGIKNPNEEDKERIRKIRMDASKILGNTALTVVQSLAQAYILTGDKIYASRGIEWAVAAASWDPDGVSSLNDFGDSRCMLAMALAYDTFHQFLTDSEKADILGAIRARASRFYHHWINEIEVKVLSNHVWQHVYHYFFQTAVATYGDLPEAEIWMEYLYELFIARAPALGRDDGAWVNGNSYFTMNMEVLLDVPLTIRDYTGFDLFQHKSWYLNNPYYLWYSLPPHSQSDGFGDNSKGFGHTNMNYVAYADALARVSGNGYAAWYAQEALMGTDRDLSDNSNLRWLRLKFLNDIEPPDYAELPELDNARIFPDAGLVYLNTDLHKTTGNLMFAMRSSPFGSYGHMLADQNAFHILYGGKPVFYHSGHKIAMNDPHRQNWYKHTKSHNGILIRGQGQPYSTEAYGWIPYFVAGESLSYTMGDASQAYHSVQHGGATDHGLDQFHRHVVMLDGGIIVLYDDLKAEKPSIWSWLVHSPLEDLIERGEGRFFFRGKELCAAIQVWATTAMEWEVSDKYETPAENWRGKQDEDGNFVDLDDDDWHVSGTTKARKSMRILAILQAGENSEQISAWELEGGKLSCKGWTIEAEMDSDKMARLKITRDDGRAVFAVGHEELELMGNTFGNPQMLPMLIENVDGNTELRTAGINIPAGIREAWTHSQKSDGIKITTP